MFIKKLLLITILCGMHVCHATDWNDIQGAYQASPSLIYDNEHEISMESPSNGPEQLIEEYTKKTLSSINAPKTRVGRHSLICYLICLECFSPWSRCLIPPLVGFGVICGTVTIAINILAAAGVIQDATTVNTVAAVFACLTLTAKTALTLSYFLIDSLNSEAKIASKALEVKTQQLLTLLETSEQNVQIQREKKQAAKQKAKELIQVSHEQNDKLLKEKQKRMVEQDRDSVIIEEKLNKIKEEYQDQLKTVLEKAS